MAHLIKCPPDKHEDLSSIPTTTYMPGFVGKGVGTDKFLELISQAM